MNAETVMSVPSYLRTTPEPITAPKPAGAPDDDALLMARFQQGDEDGFTQLFRKYRKPIMHFANRFVGNPARAEELTQDVFIKCCQARASYQPRAQFRSWLFQIARNHCLDERRRREYTVARVSVHDNPIRATGPSAEQHAAAQDLARLADESVAALPPSQRQAFLLSRVEHMSYAEIADAMGTTVSAVKSLLNRAKTSIRCQTNRV